MPNRILKESVCNSRAIDGLSPQAENLFYRLLVVADDFGRFDAATEMLRAKAFPLKIDRIKNGQIDGWLLELAKAGTVKLYENNGVRFGYFPKWEAHQRIRNKHSKYPDPTDPLSSAVNCQQVADNCLSESNPIQSNPIQIKAAGSSIPQPFLFWQKYPARNGRKVGQRKTWDEWVRLSDEDRARAIQALETQKDHYQRCKAEGVFVAEFPDPFRWLKDRRFNDEVTAPLSMADKVRALRASRGEAVQ